MKLFLIAAAVPVLASAELDRSLMSDAYWSIWNDAEQARIDADIERNRKADGTFDIAAPDGGGVKGEPLVSGLFTRDMQKKPAYHALDSLINHEWRTNVDALSRDGKVSFRGFRGRYRLSWKGQDGNRCEKLVDLE